MERNIGEKMTEKMNIAFIAPEFLPNWGGAGTYAIELVKHLSQIHNVHVITVNRKIDNVSSYNEEKIMNFFDNKIQLHTVCDAGDTFLYNAKFQYACLKNIPKICKENDIDIVHADVPHMSDVLLKLTKMKVNTVTTIHTIIEGHKDGILTSGVHFWDMDASERYTLALYPALKLIQNFYIRKSPNIITVSNWMKDLLEKSYSVDNVNVIYNGVDHNLYTPDKKNCLMKKLDCNDKSIVLCTGRLTAGKGAHYFINAIPDIIKENKDTHFVFTGSGGTKNLWIDMLKKNGIGKESYSFLGYLDYSDLANLYAKAEIFVAPSLYENFPIRILEAMSSQTAVISTDVCGIPECIENTKNGILVPSRNSKVLSDSVNGLLQDKDFSKKIAKNARKTVIEKFSWEKIGKETEKVYENIIGA